jgi:hypothetical protein
MNKKIIAIAIASAMAAPVAMADIMVSGRMAGELVSSESDGTNPTPTIMKDTGMARIYFMRLWATLSLKWVTNQVSPVT